MRRFAKPLYGLTPVPRVRIPPSPPASLNCREFPPTLTAESAKCGDISQFLLGKPDCRESTASAVAAIHVPFSLKARRAVRLPRKAEANILRSQTECFTKRDLTFVWGTQVYVCAGGPLEG